MARRAMTMSSGGRIAEHLSVGILARSYPRERIRKILEELGLQSKRVRDLPAEVLVYYVIALGLFMAVSTGEVLRSLVEGLQWLGGRSRLKVAGKAAISQGRSKLGVAPLKALWEQSVEMLAVEGQPGCFYRGLRLVAIDGSTLDVPDTEENLAYFGRQRSSRGQAAFPQMRFVSLCECGPHAIFSLRMGAYSAPESSLAQELVSELKPGMLCLADRLYSNFGLWRKAASSGAALLWRTRRNAKLPVEKVLEDGSYLSHIYPSEKAQRQKRNGLVVRVIEYELEGVEDAEPFYRLITTLLDCSQAPAEELAALYAQRWEIETLLDEFKTHLRGGRVVLRSKTPQLVEQEFYGMMLAHRAVRTLMNEAAQYQHLDPDRLSFTHSLRVIRRKLAAMPAISP
jgi:Insertion element 4 transposase N-terminal/Transposase DDE domain